MLDQTFLPSRPTVSYRRQILIVLGAGIAVFLLRDTAPAAHRAMVGFVMNYGLVYGLFDVAFVATAALIFSRPTVAGSKRRAPSSRGSDGSPY